MTAMTPFKDPVMPTKKDPSISVIKLEGDTDEVGSLAIGVKIDSEPADALDYVKSISKG